MSKNFVEFQVVNKNQLDDMIEELETLKNNNPPPITVIQDEAKKDDLEKNESDKDFCEIISSLPLKSREQAKHVINHLLKGTHFGYDIKSGEILKFIPENGYRYRIPCSNLRDILCAVTRQLAPNQTPQSEEGMIEGLKEFLRMLAATPYGSTQINDPNLRKLFQKYRKETRLT